MSEYLVKRLRDPFGSDRPIRKEAADLIEAQGAEIERLKAEREEDKANIANILNSVQVCQKAAMDACDKMEAAEAEVAALDSTCRYQAGEINRFVAALDFYADPKNWMSPTKGSFALQVDREPSPVEKTGNSIAMVALKQSCTCKIEMATFRTKGSTCLHCGKVIQTSSNL